MKSHTETSIQDNYKKIPSIELDIMRLGAALTVLYTHSKAMWFPSQQHHPGKAGDFSHAAVVFFFILSGYVIAFTTKTKNKGFLQYTQARLGRLYSIVLPGLLITALAECLVAKIDPAYYFSISRGNVVPRYLIAGVFLNEVWFFSSVIPMNGPLWSLGYEFWYYAIFGCWFFKGSNWLSWVLPIVAVIIAGPKILLMMPIWLGGVLAFRARRPTLNIKTNYVLIAMILIAAYLVISFCPPYPDQIGSVPLFWAGQFFTDYLLGILISLFMWLFPVNLISPIKFGEGLKFFREVADLTFPIYVLHWPLLELYKAIFHFQLNSLSQCTSAIITVFLISAFIGYWLNKYRPYWDRMFGLILRKVKIKTSLISYSSLAGK